MEDQTKRFALLRPEANIGVRLISTYLLEPEQSTSATVVHHLNAKYFVVQKRMREGNGSDRLQMTEGGTFVTLAMRAKCSRCAERWQSG